MSGGNVKVCCRFRPQLQNELMRGGETIAHFDSNGKSATINVIHFSLCFALVLFSLSLMSLSL